MNQEINDAIEEHNVESLLKVLKNGADPNEGATGWGVVGDAIFEMDDGAPLDIVRLLIEYGADVQGCSDKFTAKPLHLAMHTMDIELIQLLLKAGANCNTPGEEYGLPLRYAVAERKLGVARLLLNHGAKITINQNSGFCGCTALDSAAQNLDVQMIELLLHNGADPLAEDIDGRLPVSYLPAKEKSDPDLWNKSYNLLTS